MLVQNINLEHLYIFCEEYNKLLYKAHMLIKI